MGGDFSHSIRHFLSSVTARRYRCKDGSCLVELYSVDAHKDAGMAGVRLRAIGGSAEKLMNKDVRLRKKMLWDSVSFYSIYIDCGAAGGLGNE